MRLCTLLQLPDGYHAAARQAAEQFPLVAPLEYVRRMRAGDPHDPLLRQVLPLQNELEQVPGFQDALREMSNGTIEAEVVDTDPATIMPLPPEG